MRKYTETQRELNRIRVKEWRKNNLEKKNQYNSNYQKENKEKIALQRVKYSLKNAIEIKEKTKEWTKNNLEKKNQYNKKYLELNAGTIRNKTLISKYGISLEEYKNLFEKQEGKCAVCKNTQGTKKLAVDHCHTSLKVRGLLCTNCNVGLGYFKDSIERLQFAIEYLK